MRTVGFRGGHRHYRLVPSAAHHQPCWGCYVSDHGDPVWRAHGVQVITVAGDRVSAMTRFVDNSVLPFLGLPRTLP
jgi:RNA polymerase sigma-70 factor (ECF subfamily)